LLKKPTPLHVSSHLPQKTWLLQIQLIEHANLEFAAGTDITGPLVIVKNMSASSTVLEAKRQCQVVYRIYDTADTLLYDSATTEVCTTDEQITYQLQGHGIRMFPIRHTATAYPLVVGTYRFVLEYPGYGEGSVMVTIE
jgi:hypothetical protein